MIGIRSLKIHALNYRFSLKNLQVKAEFFSLILFADKGIRKAIVCKTDSIRKESEMGVVLRRNERSRKASEADPQAAGQRVFQRLR